MKFKSKFDRRVKRVRYKLSLAMKKSGIKHKLLVIKSNANICAKIVDVTTGNILAYSSSTSIKDSKLNTFTLFIILN